VWLVHPDVFDIAIENVADGADNHVAFLIDKGWCPRFPHPSDNYFPDPRQISQVALQFFLGAVYAGRANNKTQPSRGI
jgi:hypothetical protein